MKSEFIAFFLLVAVIAVSLIGGALYWIKSINDSAERAKRIVEAQTGTEVSDRVVDVLAPFTIEELDGRPFSSDHLKGHVWLGQQFDSTESPEYQAFSEIRRELHPLSVEPTLKFVSVIEPDQLPTTTQKNWIHVSSDQPDLKSSQGSGNPFADTSKCILVDPYLRIRGEYELTDEVEVERLKNDLLIVAAETTPYPDDLFQTDWLNTRAMQQQATIDQFQVPHEFSFRDIQPETGINFVNKVVDQAARGYRAAHYDHGTGIAVADVNGDDLLDVCFVKQAGRSRLYQNEGDGKFRDITEEAGLSFSQRVCVSASFADIDNDGDEDLFMTSVRGGNLMFTNDGKGKFTDITNASGLGYVGHSSSGVFFDYNRDGLLDLFVTNVGKYTTDEKRKVTMEPIHDETPADLDYYTVVDNAFGGHLLQKERGESSILYQNLGENRFEDVSEKVNLVDQSWSGAAIPVDFDTDGWPDLYVLNMQGADQYYVNLKGQSFENRTKDVFPRTSWGAMGGQSLDFENDGDMDLFITDMHSDMSQSVDWSREKEKADIQWPESFTQTGGNSVWGNSFFRNEGNEKFVEVSNQINAENYWPWGASSGDLNADGFVDVFITASMNYPYRYAVNSLLLNNRGKKFLDSEFILGVEPRRDGKVAEPMFEVTSNEVPDHVVFERRLGRASVWSSLGSRSSVIFDLENDGDLDIITNEFNSVPMVLASDLADKSEPPNFIKVKLVGTKSNRNGLGATIRIKSDSMTQTKFNDGQSGYMSQSSAPLYFGLGEDLKVLEIEVIWPSGTTQKITDVGTKPIVVITEEN